MADQLTQLTTEQGPSLAAINTPEPQAESLEPMVLASVDVAVKAEPLAPAGVSSATSSKEVYSVVVKAPPAGGMLAYLVGPGARIELQGFDINKATLAQEGGNLRITLPNGAEVLLLDYVNSAKDSHTTVVTPEGSLPAQALLAALDGTKVAGKDVTDVEPAAGPQGAGGEGGGLIPPTILGLGVGNGEGIFSSVIDPFAIPRPADAITTNEYPFEPGLAPNAPLPPVVPANQPPVARNDSFSTAINKPITMTPAQLLANDSDADGDTLTLVTVQGATHGTVAIVNGNVVFTPEAGYTGTASYSYTITDGKGGTSTADVIIQIDPTFPGQNTVIAADDTGTVVAGRAITVNVLANDSDPEGDALVPNSVRIIQGPDKGTATANPDGTISYQSVGTTPYFTTIVYEVTDARGAKDTATVTIEVIPAANSVIAVDDTGEIVPAGASKSFNVTGNDLDPQGDAFQITSIITGPTRGTASFDAKTGNIVYNSVPSATGYTEVITYEITDARGAKDQATLTIRVEPTNNVSAVDDTADLKAGQDVNIKVLRNDFDAQGDTFTISRIVGQPTVRDGSGFGSARGTVTINADGTITYTDTPGARDSAVVEFSYEIVDSKGATDIAVVRVTIGTAPNGVDANNDTLTVAENSARANVTTTLLANDFDPQGDTFKITAITQPSTGRGTVELVGDQVFFTPANGYNGPVTFTYTITDSKGATDTAQVTINVQEAPSTDLNAGDDTFTTPFNTNLTITAAQVLANDNDPEGSVLNASSIVSFTQPLNGSVTYNAATGLFVYNPNDTFRGTDTFTYTIRDAQGDTDTATVTIRVADPLPQDNPVDAVDDLVVLKPGETRTVNALTNDSAPDGGLAFVRLVDPLPAGVTNLGGGRFSYTAPDNTTGQTVSFRYEVRDVDGDTDIATVTFKVEGPVNSVDARDDAVTMNKDVQSILINAKANDVDPEGDAFTITRIISVSSGTATIENDQIRYNNPTRDAGTATIVYEITDSKGAKDTATITVTIVADTNDVTAVDDRVTMGKDVQTMLINAKANDFDSQGDDFSITRIVSVSSGTATIENGQIRYSNPTTAAGFATIVYEITDSKGAKDTATITVNIVADTNTVIANDDAVTMNKDVQTILINAKANDVDPEGDAFSITRIVSVSSGTATIENGQIRYNNPTREAGTATIVYEITDSKGAKDTATITVKIVADTNDVTAVDDKVTMAKDVDTILINAKANDFDSQGDTFSITKIISVSAGTAVIENGQIRYTNPSNGASTQTIVYEITDSKGAKDTATITVDIKADTVPNTVTAVDDKVTMAKDVDTILINAKANDFDAQGDAFSITRIVSVSSGTATIENGQIRYTNAANGASTQTIVYEITDSKGAKDTATITVDIKADTVPNTVTAVDDKVTMAKDVDTILINAKANDFDAQGDSFSITRIVSVSAGTATIENGQIRYTNPSNGASTQTIVYEITDSKGAKDTATITVDIKADTVPNTVTAVDDKVTMAKDVDTILINAKANDFDAQGDSFSITRIVSVSAGTATIENGQIRYTNADNAASTQTIVYEITDSKGAKDTATITVDIKADTKPVNDVTAVDDTVTMAKDVDTILINAKANDFDRQGDAFSITRIVSVSAGTAVIENGQIRYTNASDAASTQTIVYEITDSKGAKDTATITVDIKADTPVVENTVVARDDSYRMAAKASVDLKVLSNDFDPQGDSFKIISITKASIGNATIAPDGKSIYYWATTNGGYTTKVTYVIEDARGARDTAEVTIVVNPKPTTPTTGTNTGGTSNDGDGDGRGGRCPLTIDLNGDGISIVMQAASKAHFDLDGNGTAEWTSWVNGADDAILAIDRNGDGVINNVHEVFGDQGVDGFSELRQLEDTNSDGVIDKNDANWSSLKLWLDANHDGITDAGELHGLEEFGIVSINTKANATSIQYGDAYISHQGTVTLNDGSHLSASSVFYTNDSNGHLTGTNANDVLIFSAAADSIDGGQGVDTLKVLAASDIVISHDTVHSVESIDLANNGADKLSLNIDDVLTMSDNGVLTITGDAVDQITLTGNVTHGENVTQNGQTYASYTSSNGGTVLVELGLSVHTQESQH